MTNFISIKCPECDAPLQLEEGRKTCFCSYCGTKIMLNNDNEYVYRTIDEAEINKENVRKEIRLKELEMEEAQHKRDEKKSKIHIIGGIIVGAIGFLTSLGDSYKSESIGLLLIIIAVCILVSGRDPESK